MWPVCFCECFIDTQWYPVLS
ncbi:rCG53891 [Rattus norvegicus]|uniref:RCG53891 n=1 Tax=Rattus norvegicus TaxID=10116 RepID=A6J9T0_RAT|nr:rCG53891 [Rattus norvegicus]